MAIGDALAIALLECREFTDNDFAKYHPGGALGKKLHLKVNDLVILNQKPMVNADCKLHDVILEITKKRLGIVAVLHNQKLIGVITDGDLRRMMEKHKTFEHLTAKDIMGANPITIDTNQLAIKALNLMTSKQITQIIVTKNNVFEGVVHLHDLLKENIL
jgi:arabinose-5-phosphate isomerase